MKHLKYLLNADYLVIEDDEISMSSKPFNNKILSDEIDEEDQEYDIPDPWFKSIFDDIYDDWDVEIS